jgi:RNA polymerase sigma factor (sigma-70 family)
MGDALAARTADQPLLSGRVLRVLTDEKLAAMVAAGSDDAFATLYQRYHQPIYRYCLSLLHQEADARDALQSSMLAALSSLRARPIDGAFKPWLFRIAHNESISIIRGRTKEPPTDAPSTEAVSDDPETREQLRTMVSDLGALPDRQRGAIVMRELSGLSYAEIGAVLGTSEAAGKQLVYEARTAMQELREGHEMSCELVRERISAHDRRLLRGRKVRAHLRGCQPCQDFDEAIRRRRSAFALLAPPLSPLVAAAVLHDVFGGGGSVGGAGGAGTAAGASGLASGGFPVAAPLALKAAAAVVLAGAAGVGAYEAGSAIFSDSATRTPAAVTHREAAPAHHTAKLSSDHAARAASKRAADRGAPAHAAAKSKTDASAGASQPSAPGEAAPGGDSVSPGTTGGSAPADTAGSGPSGTGSSDNSGTAGSDPSAPSSSSGGSADSGSSGGSSSGGSSGGDTGGSGGGSGGGDPGGGSDPPPPADPPPDPTPPPEAPPGTPPGHGGVPPGQGGVPPGQVPGDVPPGQINNPGHGGGH